MKDSLGFGAIPLRQGTIQINAGNPGRVRRISLRQLLKVRPEGHRIRVLSIRQAPEDGAGVKVIWIDGGGAFQQRAGFGVATHAPKGEPSFLERDRVPRTRLDRSLEIFHGIIPAPLASIDRTDD